MFLVFLACCWTENQVCWPHPERWCHHTTLSQSADPEGLTSVFLREKQLISDDQWSSHRSPSSAWTRGTYEVMWSPLQHEAALSGVVTSTNTTRVDFPVWKCLNESVLKDENKVEKVKCCHQELFLLLIATCSSESFYVSIKDQVTDLKNITVTVTRDQVLLYPPITQPGWVFQLEKFR